MDLPDGATNVFMGLPEDGDRLELTFNPGVDSYDMGTGYNHIALVVDGLDGVLNHLSSAGIEPEKPPYNVGEGGSRICFVRDPDTMRSIADAGRAARSDNAGAWNSPGTSVSAT